MYLSLCPLSKCSLLLSSCHQSLKTLFNEDLIKNFKTFFSTNFNKKKITGPLYFDAISQSVCVVGTFFAKSDIWRSDFRMNSQELLTLDWAVHVRLINALAYSLHRRRIKGTLETRSEYHSMRRHLSPKIENNLENIMFQLG